MSNESSIGWANNATGSTRLHSNGRRRPIATEVCQIIHQISPALRGLAGPVPVVKNGSPEDSWRRSWRQLIPIVARDEKMAALTPLQWEMVARVLIWLRKRQYHLSQVLRAGYECYRMNAWTAKATERS